VHLTVLWAPATGVDARAQPFAWNRCYRDAMAACVEHPDLACFLPQNCTDATNSHACMGNGQVLFQLAVG